MDNDSDLIDSKTGEILLDSANTIEAYQWMASLVHEYHVASPDGVTDEKKGGRDAFLSGKVGIMMNSTGNYVRSKKALGDDLGVLPMPCNKVLLCTNRRCRYRHSFYCRAGCERRGLQIHQLCCVS